MALIGFRLDESRSSDPDLAKSSQRVPIGRDAVHRRAARRKSKTHDRAAAAARRCAGQRQVS
jgi:hypothetical protein